MRPCCSGSTGSFPLVCILLASVPSYLFPHLAVTRVGDPRLGERDIHSFTSAQSPLANGPPPPEGRSLFSSLMRDVSAWDADPCVIHVDDTSAVEIAEPFDVP